MQGNVTEARSGSLSSDTESMFSGMTEYPESVDTAAETPVTAERDTLRRSRSTGLLIEGHFDSSERFVFDKSQKDGTSPTSLLIILGKVLTSLRDVSDETLKLLNESRQNQK